MRRVFLALNAVFGLMILASQPVVAQRSATLNGIIKFDSTLPQGTRVAVHVIDSDGVWGLEVSSVVPVAGTFSITASPVPEDELKPFRSGAVLLPGLQNEYRVTPDDVHYAQGRVNMYVDNNHNGIFDRIIDNFFVGVPSLEEPVGFFSLLYVDKDATMISSEVELQLQAGWNIFSVRFPQGEDPVYTIRPLVEDAILDVFLP